MSIVFWVLILTGQSNRPPTVVHTFKTEAGCLYAAAQVDQKAKFAQFPICIELKENAK